MESGELFLPLESSRLATIRTVQLWKAATTTTTTTTTTTKHSRQHRRLEPGKAPLA